jgi:hypothetical protein
MTIVGFCIYQSKKDIVMKKKAIAKLTAAGLLILISATSKLLAAGSLEERLGIKITGGGTFVVQGTSKKNAKINGDDLPSCDFDLKLTKEFQNDGKIVVSFKDAKGSLPTRNLQTYATLNPIADQSFETELFYQQSFVPFVNDSFTINFGMLDFGTHFGNNKYSNSKNSQFITSIFATDKIVEKPPKRMAAHLNYALGEIWGFSGACFLREINNLNFDWAIQVACKPSRRTNCLVYMWKNNQYHFLSEDVKNKNRKNLGNLGLGVSLDQEISDDIGIFARVSWKNPSRIPAIAFENTRGVVSNDNLNMLLSFSWNIGTQIKGTFWSRKDDALGFAIGQMYGSSSYKRYRNPEYKDGAETEIELYYKFGLNEHFAISPIAQFVISPRGGNVIGKDKDASIFIFGIRARINF